MAPPSPVSLQEVIQWVDTETGEEQPLARLQTASALVRELAEIGDAVLGYFVDQARHAGHSWSEIGDALGVSKQAAQQRHTVRMALGPNAPTFERFTPRARTVVTDAELIAREWGHEHVGGEHLLLALYREPEGVGAQILVEAGLTYDRVSSAVAARVERGSGAPGGKLTFSPPALAVFTGALASALEMGHNYIGTEHLLLGVARGEGAASDVLDEFGLTEDVAAAAVIEKLDAYVTRRREKVHRADKASPRRNAKAGSTASTTTPRARGGT
jgi:hypothetical protein